MILDTLQVGPLDVNCYLVGDPDGSALFIVDPGGNASDIIARINTLHRSVKGVIATHGHFDHIGDVDNLATHYDVPFHIHEADRPLLQLITAQAAQFGLDCPAITVKPALIADGDRLSVDNLHLQIIHTPGHSPGGVCLYCKEHQYLLTGDTLFCESVGRTDLPGGDFDTLITSLHSRIMTLPETVTVHPGHGPASSIQHEKANNPFI